MTRGLNYIEKAAMYGLLGLAVEIFFTGIASAINGDVTLEGKTYILMVFVWATGMYALEFAGVWLRKFNWFVRCFAYASVCLSIEFVWGLFFLLTLGVIPWDYTGSSDWVVLGVIRLDYFYFWCVAGALSEPMIKWINLLRIER